MGQVLRAEGIDLHFVDLAPDVRESVVSAQRRQFR